MSIRATVTAHFMRVADEQSKSLQPLTDDLALLDSGLDSLCFAIIVARLEDDLGLDPFASNEDAAFPVKFGEFVALYETTSVAPASA